jgi:Holliday junction resolvase-like predicted endonuclease
VVARNLAVGRGEIDLLVRFGTRHVAVEVKTVGSGALAGDPVERITPAKLAQVRRLAGALAPRYGSVRVDFVGVRIGQTGVTVNWRANVA